MIENPIFIVGTERSGSNLLRLLLNETPGVTIPHPPHLMRDLTPRLKHFGDLNGDANFKRLIASAIRLVELHFAPWPLKIDAEKVFTEAPARDLYSVYAAIYEQFRAHKGKARWACKSTFMIHHVDEILKHHRSAQFIHLVRDPRDVAVSARKSVFCHYHPYFVADLWRREQSLAIIAESRLNDSQWLTLRYEDLIHDPAQEMQRVCAFLGEKYSEDLLKYFEKPAARELSGLSRSWENVARPVMSSNSEKFRQELSADAIALIESVAGEEMKRFDYPLGEKQITPTVFTRAGYRLQEEWMMWTEEARAFLRDRNSKIRLRKKGYLLSLGIRR